MIEEKHIPESRLERFYFEKEQKPPELLCPYCGSRALLPGKDIGLLCCQRCLHAFAFSDFSLSRLSWLEAMLEKVQYAFLHQSLDRETLLLQAKVVEYELEKLLETEKKPGENREILLLLARVESLLSFLYDLQDQRELALKQAQRALLCRELLIDLDASLTSLFFLAIAHFDLGLLIDLQGSESFKPAEFHIDNALHLLSLAMRQAQAEKEKELIRVIEQREIYQFKRAAMFYLDHQDIEKAGALIEKALEKLERSLNPGQSKKKNKRTDKRIHTNKHGPKKKAKEAEANKKLQEKAEILSLAQQIYFEQGQDEKSLEAIKSALSLQKSLLEESLQKLAIDSWSEPSSIWLEENPDVTTFSLPESQEQTLQSSENDFFDETDVDLFDLIEQMDQILFLYERLVFLYRKLEKEEQAFNSVRELAFTFSVLFDSGLMQEGIAGKEIEKFLITLYLHQADLFRSLFHLDEAEKALKKAMELIEAMPLKKRGLQEQESLFQIFLNLDAIYQERENGKKREENLHLLDQLLEQVSVQEAAINKERVAFWTFQLQCKKTSYYLDLTKRKDAADQADQSGKSCRDKAMDWALQAQESFNQLEKSRESLDADCLKAAYRLYINLALLFASDQDLAKAEAFFKKAEKYKNQLDV